MKPNNACVKTSREEHFYPRIRHLLTCLSFLIWLAGAQPVAGQSDKPVESLEQTEVSLEFKKGISLMEGIQKITSSTSVPIQLTEKAKKSLTSSDITLYAQEYDRDISANLRQFLDLILDLAEAKRLTGDKKILVGTPGELSSRTKKDVSLEPDPVEPDFFDTQVDSVKSWLETKSLIGVFSKIGNIITKKKGVDMKTLHKILQYKLALPVLFTKQLKKHVDQNPVPLPRHYKSVTQILNIADDFGVSYVFRHGCLFLGTEEETRRVESSSSMPARIKSKMRDLLWKLNRNARQELKTTKMSISMKNEDITNWLESINKKISAILMGPGLRKSHSEQPILMTVHATDRPVKSILEQSLQNKSFRYAIRRGIVYIETAERLEEMRNLQEDPEFNRRIKRLIKAMKAGQYESAGKIITAIKDKKRRGQLKQYVNRVKKFQKQLRSRHYQKSIEQYNNIQKLTEIFQETNRNRLTRYLIQKGRNHKGLKTYLEKLIKNLGARSFKKRSGAMKELSRAGKLALEELKKHKDHQNPEIRSRIEKLLKSIQR